MDQIKHNSLEINGLRLSVAEIGSESSPAVIFLQGLSDTWYHQMIAVANAGFRAITPDYRGYGPSDIPAEPEETSFFDFVKDTASIVDSLAISKVFIIGKDLGSLVGYTFAQFHPEKVAAVISIGVAFRPPRARVPQAVFEGYYTNRKQEPGKAEADFGSFGVRNLFSKSETSIAAEKQDIMLGPWPPLPYWVTKDDLEFYGSLYESGFQTPHQVPNRILKSKTEPPKQAPKDLKFDIRGRVPKHMKLEAPTLLIMGEKDFVFTFPGTEEYVRSGEIKRYAPNIEIIYVPERSHFIHEHFPDHVNQLILNFLNCNKH